MVVKAALKTMAPPYYTMMEESTLELLRSRTVHLLPFFTKIRPEIEFLSSYIW